MDNFTQPVEMQPAERPAPPKKSNEEKDELVPAGKSTANKRKKISDLVAKNPIIIDLLGQFLKGGDIS